MPVSTIGTNGLTSGLGVTASTLSVNGNNISAVNSLGFRNRIINGNMVIDQRNNGAQITIPNASSAYPADRFQVFKDTSSGVFYGQQSTTAPTGFSNALLLTANTAWTPASGDLAVTQQKIEAFNTSDLVFGTASAATVTLSFWVRSSITGTYAVALINSANNRSYVATYTINAANTFEFKTITIAGDTAGTWVSGTNGIGLRVNFDLGSGSTYNTTAGAWATGLFTRTSGSVNWTQTSGATFYITGVQLEAGSVASPFERRDYGRELIMCQRYFERFGTCGVGGSRTSTGFSMNFKFQVAKRTSPTVTHLANYSLLIPGVAAFTCTGISAQWSVPTGVQLTVTSSSGASSAGLAVLYGDSEASENLAASAEL